MAQFTKFNNPNKKRRRRKASYGSEYKKVCDETLLNALREAGSIDDAQAWKTYDVMLHK